MVYLVLALLLVSLVLLLGHEVLKGVHVSDLDLSHPAGVRIVVDEGRVVLELRVNGGNDTTNGHDDVGSSLHGLDGAENLVLSALSLDLGKLGKDNLAKVVGGVLGDPNAAAAVLDINELVSMGQKSELGRQTLVKYLVPKARMKEVLSKTD